MTDAELHAWSPDIGTVAAALRRTDRPSKADLLVDAVRAGATSSEILGAIGGVLRDHCELRSQLSEPDANAWDAVMADVHGAFPGSRFRMWIAQLKNRRT